MMFSKTHSLMPMAQRERHFRINYSPYAVVRDLSRIFKRHECRATGKLRNISQLNKKAAAGAPQPETTGEF
ncbi:MAG: hypothetical protein HRF47_00310 [Chloroflexota bacterium]|jgi:hypothetical protein